jgi:hypothetical protein
MASKLKFDLTNTSTANLVDSQKIYHTALIQGGSKETFEQILDVKDKARIRKHVFGNVLQSDSCTFGEQGTGALSEKEVAVCPLKINLEICQRTLESSYVANQMRSGSISADFLPAEFVGYVTEKLQEKMAADLETLVWQGDVSLTGGTYPVALCDGLLAIAGADSDVIDVSATTITASNVIAELQRVYDAIPDAIKFSPELRLYVSTNIASAYKQAVAAASAEVFFVKNSELTFLGVPMVLSQGLPANRMMAAEKTNLFLVADLVDDFEDIKILPMLDRTGDNTVRIVGRFKYAVNYAYGAEICLYA